MFWDWLSKAQELKTAGKIFALVTITDTKGSTPRETGAKMIVMPEIFFGTIGGGNLEQEVLQEARGYLTSQTLDRPGTESRYPLCFRTGQCCGGSVNFFIEIIGLQPEIHIFGAGHVGQALVKTLVGTPFRVHLIDERPEWINHQDLPTSTLRHHQSGEQYLQTMRWDPQLTYMVVMTHDHGLDLELIAGMIDQKARFIGLIGSETKWSRFRQRLEKLGKIAMLWTECNVLLA